MPLLMIFQIHNGCQLYWWWKPKYTEMTIDHVLSYRHYHTKTYRVHLAMCMMPNHKHIYDTLCGRFGPIDCLYQERKVSGHVFVC